MRHLGVVGVGIVNWIVFSLAHIRCKGLAAVIICLRIIRLSIVLDEILNEWVRAGGVVRWIRQSQDVLVLTNRKPFDLAELRVFEFLAQFLQEILPAILIIGEGHAQTFHRLIFLLPKYFLVRFFKHVPLGIGKEPF